MAVVKAPYVIRFLPGKADAIGVRTVPPSKRFVFAWAAQPPHPRIPGNRAGSRASSIYGRS